MTTQLTGRSEGAFAASTASLVSVIARRVLEAAVGSVSLFLTWQDRIRERRQLAAFDDRMMKDIGLSRCDVWRESEKPFWRA